jgi:biotin operon repressor
MEKTISYITIHGSKENPVTNKEICKFLGISEQSVRHHINMARCEGIPVCSCTQGYYISNEKVDIVMTIQSLMNRTMAVEKAVNGLLTALWDKVE